MNSPQLDELNRRDLLKGGVAALAALMLDAAGAVHAAEKTGLRADPRYAFADRISDLVIPTTDTPGASAAHVADFVLLAVDRGMGEMKPGMLQQVRESLDTAAGGSFLRLPRARQATLLARLDKAAYAANDPAAGTVAHSWRRVKTAIVAGYYTSEIGASKELVYEPVPGPYRNIKLTPSFRNRSNDGFGSDL
jgi:hypothetical protein